MAEDDNIMLNFLVYFLFFVPALCARTNTLLIQARRDVQFVVR